MADDVNPNLDTAKAEQIFRQEFAKRGYTVWGPAPPHPLDAFLKLPPSDKLYGQGIVKVQAYLLLKKINERSTEFTGECRESRLDKIARKHRVISNSLTALQKLKPDDYLPEALACRIRRSTSTGVLSLNCYLFFPKKGNRTHLFLIGRHLRPGPIMAGTRERSPLVIVTPLPPILFTPTVPHLARDIHRIFDQIRRITESCLSDLFNTTRAAGAEMYGDFLLEIVKKTTEKSEDGTYFGRVLLYNCGEHAPLFAAISRQVVCTECNPTMTKKVNSLTRGLGNVEVRQVKPDHLPISGGPFDCVVVVESIAFVASTRKTLTALVSALVPDGLFIASFRAASLCNFQANMPRIARDLEDMGIFCHLEDYFHYRLNRECYAARGEKLPPLADMPLTQSSVHVLYGVKRT